MACFFHRNNGKTSHKLPINDADKFRTGTLDIHNWHNNVGGGGWKIQELNSENLPTIQNRLFETIPTEQSSD